jgi:hypothetical protein
VDASGRRGDSVVQRFPACATFGDSMGGFSASFVAPSSLTLFFLCKRSLSVMVVENGWRLRSRELRLTVEWDSNKRSRRLCCEGTSESSASSYTFAVFARESQRALRVKMAAN